MLRLSQSDMNEYGDEVVSNPTTAEGWKEIAASYFSRWNFHHVLGALDGKHIRIRCPANGGSQFYNYRGTIQLCSLRSLTQTTGLRASWSPRSSIWYPAVEWVDIARCSHHQLHRYLTSGISARSRKAQTVFHNLGQRICSQRVDDEVVRCSTLWNRTSWFLIIAFLTADDALRMPLAYWSIAWAAYSQPFAKSRRM